MQALTWIQSYVFHLISWSLVRKNKTAQLDLQNGDNKWASGTFTRPAQQFNDIAIRVSGVDRKRSLEQELQEKALLLRRRSARCYKLSDRFEKKAALQTVLQQRCEQR